MNPMISKEGVSLMLLSQLPRSLHDWSSALCSAPCWQLTPEALLPASRAHDGAWLVLFGRALDAGHLGRLARLPPFALRGTKKAINHALKNLALSTFEFGVSLETQSQLSRDHAEAVDAFIDKRKPQYTGR